MYWSWEWASCSVHAWTRWRGSFIRYVQINATVLVSVSTYTHGPQTRRKRMKSDEHWSIRLRASYKYYTVHTALYCEPECSMHRNKVIHLLLSLIPRLSLVGTVWELGYPLMLLRSSLVQTSLFWHFSFQKIRHFPCRACFQNMCMYGSCKLKITQSN